MPFLTPAAQVERAAIESKIREAIFKAVELEARGRRHGLNDTAYAYQKACGELARLLKQCVLHCASNTFDIVKWYKDTINDWVNESVRSTSCHRGLAVHLLCPNEKFAVVGWENNKSKNIPTADEPADKIHPFRLQVVFENSQQFGIVQSWISDDYHLELELDDADEENNTIYLVPNNIRDSVFRASYYFHEYMQDQGALEIGINYLIYKEQ